MGLHVATDLAQVGFSQSAHADDPSDDVYVPSAQSSQSSPRKSGMLW